jgi:hypothetical protein
MTKLTCAQCGDLIKTIDGGWVEWLVAERHPVPGSLRLVHHVTEKKGCQYQKDDPQVRKVALLDLPLSYFIGIDGYNRILEEIEHNNVTQKDGFALLRQLWEAKL